MKCSTEGLNILIEREAAKNKAYQDSVGVWTIGVGHTGPEVGAGLEWTNKQIFDAFAVDIARFENAVNGACKTVQLAQNEFDALVSFSFNVGAGALAHGGDNNGPSGILRALIKGDKVGAAKAFDNWHIPSEITSRRNAERQQFKGTVPIQARIP